FQRRQSPDYPTLRIGRMAFAPLYKLAPGAAREDPKLYEFLVLTDAIRGECSREQQLAIRELKARLEDDA
ncbi:MAG: hypothetical protein ACOC0Q_02000, partial [Wenzhouxiangella sp.]